MYISYKMDKGKLEARDMIWVKVAATDFHPCSLGVRGWQILWSPPQEQPPPLPPAPLSSASYRGRAILNWVQGHNSAIWHIMS